MREHNIYQDMEAARMNAVQSINEDFCIKHIIYGQRTTYDSSMTVYNNPIVFHHDETYEKYLNMNPAEVLYIIHGNEVY